jgi:hypothetical protein
MSLRSLFVLPLLVPGLCQADSTLTYASETRPGSETIIQVKGEDVLMGDREAKMLFLGGRQEVIIIDYPSKTYMVIDEETVKRLEQQMSAARQQMSIVMEQMQAQMENMTEEQRAQMQRMMESQMSSGGTKTPVKTTVKKQGEDRVAGVSCTMLLILVNDKPSGKVCVAQAGALGLDTQDYHSMANATDTVRRFMEQVSGRNDNDTVSMNLRAMKGIPVRMSDLVDGDVSILASRSSAELDPGLFRVPEGYKKRDMLQ